MGRVPSCSTPESNVRWPWDGEVQRVELIDEDQGKSGAHAEIRGGFQRLLAEMS